MVNKKAVVIDGNSLMYRMFYATYNLAEYAVNNNLIPVNAVKLMIETCYKIKQLNYDYCFVAFDHDKKTLRHEIFQDYKLGRKKMPPELVTQIPLIKEALLILGFNILSLTGIEADDLIGSFCNLMNQKNVLVDVYSSDKDMLQLVNDNTYVHLIKTGLTNTIIYTPENFSNLFFGLKPNQIPDYKGIVGDKSDNLVGIKGIGDKTGLKLILTYGSLENIYLNINKLSKSEQQKFIEYKETAMLCKKLATIDIHCLTDEYNETFFSSKAVDKKAMLAFLKEYKIGGLNKYFELENEVDQIMLFN